MGTWMAFGSLSGWESREGHQCSGGWLPNLQELPLPPCCPEIPCSGKGCPSVLERTSVTAVGASVGFI